MDIESKYQSSGGSLPSILASIPHSSFANESRIIDVVNSLIVSGSLESTKKWESTSTDKTAAEKRRKKGEKEAKEAEKAAKDLGVWEEFYGSGEKGKRKGGKKDEPKSAANGEDALAAVILKRQKDREGGLDAIAAKYAKIEEEERAKKKAKKSTGKKAANHENAGGGTKEMTDEEFAALQEKMFGSKDNKTAKKAKA